MSVWLPMGFLKGIPRDIEEQALVDGYSRLGAFVRTVVPLAFPGIVAVVVFAFVLTASEFIYALRLPEGPTPCRSIKDRSDKWPPPSRGMFRTQP